MKQSLISKLRVFFITINTLAFYGGFSQSYPIRVTLNDWRYISIDESICTIEKKYYVGYDFHEDYALVEDSNQFGFIDTCGVYRLNLDYQNVRSFNNGIATFQLNGLWGGIDKEGKVVVQNIFESLTDFSGGIAIGKKANGNYLIVKLNGQTVPIAGTPLRVFNGVVKVKTSHGYSYVDSEGAPILNIIFDQAFDFSSQISIVSKNEKYGAVNLQGELVIPFIFEDIRPFFGDSSVGRLNNTSYLINKTGKVLKKLDGVDDILGYKNGVLICVKSSLNGQFMGVKNLNNEWILQSIFRGINFTDNYLICYADSMAFVYDYRGEEKLKGKFSYIEELESGVLRIFKGGNPLQIYSNSNIKMGYFRDKWLINLN